MVKLVNSRHEVPNLVPILYFASFFLLPLSLSSFLVIRPPSCPSCLRFAFRYLLLHFVRHFYTPFCLFPVAKTTSTSVLPNRPRAHHSTCIAPFPAAKTTSVFPRSPCVPRAHLAHLASIEILGTGVSPCHVAKTTSTSVLPNRPRAHHSTCIALFPTTKTTSAFSHLLRSHRSASTGPIFPHAMPRRQRQFSHILLAHIIRPVLPFFPPRRQRQLSYIVLAFPWYYDTFSFVVESFRGRKDCLRCCLFCCFI